MYLQCFQGAKFVEQVFWDDTHSVLVQFQPFNSCQIIETTSLQICNTIVGQKTKGKKRYHINTNINN